MQAVDDAVLRFMEAIRITPLTWLARAMDVAGSVAVTWPLRVLAVVLLLRARRYLQLSAFLTIVLTSELCIGPLKALVDRPRPPDPMVLTSGASYPSGHAIATAVTAVGVVIALIPPGPLRLKWEIYAGAHHLRHGVVPGVPRRALVLRRGRRDAHRARPLPPVAGLVRRGARPSVHPDRQRHQVTGDDCRAGAMRARQYR